MRRPLFCSIRHSNVIRPRIIFFIFKQERLILIKEKSHITKERSSELKRSAHKLQQKPSQKRTQDNYEHKLYSYLQLSGLLHLINRQFNIRKSLPLHYKTGTNLLITSLNSLSITPKRSTITNVYQTIILSNYKSKEIYNLYDYLSA